MRSFLERRNILQAVRIFSSTDKYSLPQRLLRLQRKCSSFSSLRTPRGRPAKGREQQSRGTPGPGPGLLARSPTASASLRLSQQFSVSLCELLIDQGTHGLGCRCRLPGSVIRKGRARGEADVCGLCAGGSLAGWSPSARRGL